MSDKHWVGEYNDFIGVYKNVIDQKHRNAFLEWVDWCYKNNFTKPSWTPGDNLMMEEREHQLDVAGKKRDTVLNSPIKFHHSDKYVDQFLLTFFQVRKNWNYCYSFGGISSI